MNAFKEYIEENYHLDIEDAWTDAIAKIGKENPEISSDCEELSRAIEFGGLLEMSDRLDEFPAVGAKLLEAFESLDK